jgi:hypothetical protein
MAMAVKITIVPGWDAMSIGNSLSVLWECREIYSSNLKILATLPSFQFVQTIIVKIFCLFDILL